MATDFIASGSATLVRSAGKIVKARCPLAMGGEDSYAQFGKGFRKTPMVVRGKSI